MIPLFDRNADKTFPFITVGLILVCLYVFFFVQPTAYTSPLAGATAKTHAKNESTLFTIGHAAIPCEIMQDRPLTVDEVRRTFISGNAEACTSSPVGPALDAKKNVYAGLLYSVFLHTGVLHLAFNMLFLFIFGNNIEARMGHFRFLAFFLLVGMTSTLVHVIAQASSTVPIIGASGAIAGIMGAYLLLYPTSKIRVLLVVIPVSLPAWLFLGFWFFSQFFISPSEGVAWIAHVSGFICGMAAGAYFRWATDSSTTPRLPPPQAGLAPRI